MHVVSATRTAAAVAVAIVASVCVACQSPTAQAASRRPADAAGAQRLLARAVEAHGGPEAIEKIEGAGRREGIFRQLFPALNEGTFTEWRKGERILVEVRLGSIEVAQGYDGERAWVRSFGQVIDAPQQVQTAIEEELRHSLSLLACTGDCAVEPADPDTALDGTPLEGVRVSPAGDVPPTNFYFDPQTGRVAKITYRDVNPYKGGVAAFEHYVLEYEVFDGVVFPSKLAHFIDGVQIDEVSYESAEFDVEIPDSTFDKPAAFQQEAEDRRASLPEGTSKVDLPLEYSLNLLFVRVRVGGDGAPRIFIFDTGAGLTCVSRELAEELGLEATGGMSAAAAGGALEAHTSHIDTLWLGDLLVTDLDVMVIDTKAMSDMMGRSIDGIVGYNVLNRYTTTIDIRGRRISFEPPEAPLPSGEDAVAVPFQILMGVPLVTGVVDGKETLDFLVDTGASTSLLPKAVAERLRPTARLEGAAAAGADSRQIDLAVARFEKLSIGDAVAESPIFSYPLTEERSDPVGMSVDTATRGIIGTEILRDFVVTLNYDRAVMVFRPVARGPEEAWEWCSPGVNVYLKGDSFVVRSVFKGSPASESLGPGDRILEIDGETVEGKTLQEVVSMLRGKPGTEVTIVFVRNGKTITSRVKRAKLL